MARRTPRPLLWVVGALASAGVMVGAAPQAHAAGTAELLAAKVWRDRTPDGELVVVTVGPGGAPRYETVGRTRTLAATTDALRDAAGEGPLLLAGWDRPVTITAANEPPADGSGTVRQAQPGTTTAQAWPLSDGTGVTVAVVDTGVGPHPQLDSRLLPGISVDHGVISSDSSDRNGHGTHVAGIIAAQPNEYGPTGGAPQANILPVRVLDRTGHGWWSDIAAGVVWAAGGDIGTGTNPNPAQVINLSLSGVDGSNLIGPAVAYALGRGVSVIAAAGNFSQIQTDRTVRWDPTDTGDGTATGWRIERGSPNGGRCEEMQTVGTVSGTSSGTWLDDSADHSGPYCYTVTSYVDREGASRPVRETAAGVDTDGKPLRQLNWDGADSEADGPWDGLRVLVTNRLLTNPCPSARDEWWTVAETSDLAGGTLTVRDTNPDPSRFGWCQRIVPFRHRDLDTRNATSENYTDDDSIDQTPANLPGVLAVGSTDPTGRLSNFSNGGRWLAVVAPGELVASTYPNYVWPYAHLSGTSMAAAQVSAAAALIRSRHPDADASQVYAAIIGSAHEQITVSDMRPCLCDTVAGHDPYFGWGSLDTAAAVRLSDTITGHEPRNVPAAPPAGSVTTPNPPAVVPDPPLPVAPPAPVSQIPAPPTNRDTHPGTPDSVTPTTLPVTLPAAAPSTAPATTETALGLWARVQDVDVLVTCSSCAGQTAGTIFEWYRDGMLLSRDGRPFLLDRGGATAAGVRTYRLRLVTPAGTAGTGNATITITPPPPPRLGTIRRNGTRTTLTVHTTAGNVTQLLVYRDGALVGRGRGRGPVRVTVRGGSGRYEVRASTTNGTSTPSNARRGG